MSVRFVIGIRPKNYAVPGWAVRIVQAGMWAMVAGFAVVGLILAYAICSIVLGLG